MARSHCPGKLLKAPRYSQDFSPYRVLPQTRQAPAGPAGGAGARGAAAVCMSVSRNVRLELGPTAIRPTERSDLEELLALRLANPSSANLIKRRLIRPKRIPSPPRRGILRSQLRAVSVSRSSWQVELPRYLALVVEIRRPESSRLKPTSLTA